MESVSTVHSYAVHAELGMQRSRFDGKRRPHVHRDIAARYRMTIRRVG
jgi:hypothetical protein